MRRLLPIAVVVMVLGAADPGGATNGQYNIDIVAIDLAGRQTNLTHDPAMDLSPAVARDGRIVFLSTRGAYPDLYVMDADGGNVHSLTNSDVDDSLDIAAAEDLEFSQASWSPSGNRIAFDGKSNAAGPPCEQHCATWDVLTIGSDGSGLAHVASVGRAPAWSPDGRSLAYESGIDGYYKAGSVTIARLDGSASVTVRAVNEFSDVGPVWSPRGGVIAFQETGGGSTWIYTVGTDGRRKRRLTAGHNPVWSPDGRRIAFVDNYRLVTMNRNGRDKRRLSRKGEFVIDAAWSPKGGTIAYVAGTTYNSGSALPSNLRIETVRADGTRHRVLARESASSLVWSGPVWTPDGKRILVAVEPH